MRGLREITLILCAASALALTTRARAEGETLMPGGALAISRGGAVVAHAADAMSLLHNPASLTELAGHHAHYGVDLEIDALCVHPYGYYGWGIVLPEQRPGSAPNADVRRSEFGDPASSAYGRRPLDYVCNSGQLSPIPQLAASFQVHERVRVALGLVAPVLVTGAQWGGSDGTIATGERARPTPTRYALVHQEVLFALQPSVGVAYRALPWLSFGLGLQVGMGALDSYQVMALRAGTSPSNDMMTKLHASDYFVPSLTLGAYANPGPHWRFGATFNWTEGVDGSGDLTFTTNYYHSGGVNDEFVAFENAPVRVKRVRVPMPWTATLGVRYAEPRPGAALSGDPLSRELWDIELDASLIGSGHVGPNLAEVAGDFALEFRRANGEPQQSLDVKRSDLSQLSVDRHGLDMLVLRLGGSWNMLPGLLQTSAGAFFQSRGVDADYASVDNYGFARLGFGLGAKARLGPLEITVAYSHIFQETLEVAPPAHEPRDQASDDPKRGFDQRIHDDGVLSEGPVSDPRAPSTGKADGIASARQTAVFESENVRARVINAGRYTASFNVLSIAVTHRF